MEPKDFSSFKSATAFYVEREIIQTISDVKHKFCTGPHQAIDVAAKSKGIFG